MFKINNNIFKVIMITNYFLIWILIFFYCLICFEWDSFILFSEETEINSNFENLPELPEELKNKTKEVKGTRKYFYSDKDFLNHIRQLEKDFKIKNTIPTMNFDKIILNNRLELNLKKSYFSNYYLKDISYFEIDYILKIDKDDYRNSDIKVRDLIIIGNNLFIMGALPEDNQCEVIDTLFHYNFINNRYEKSLDVPITFLTHYDRFFNYLLFLEFYSNIKLPAYVTEQLKDFAKKSENYDL